MGLRGARGSSLQRSKGVESSIYNSVSTWFASHSNMTLRVVPTGSPGVKLTAFQGVKGWGFRVPGGQGVGQQYSRGSTGRFDGFSDDLGRIYAYKVILMI